MGTFIQDIATGGGAIAARQANKAFDSQNQLNQQAQALRERQLANYEKYAGESSADRANARQGNTAYGQMGLTDRNQADGYLPNLYSQYAKANNLTGFTAPVTPSTQANRTTPATNRTTPPNAQAGSPQVAESASPYELAPAQAQQLNQQIDRINAQRQSAIAQYRTLAAQSGAGPNMAMEQYINEQFDRQSQEASAQFAETARQQQSQAAMNFIQQFTNQRNTGTQQYGQSLDRLLQIGSQALASGEGGPYGTQARDLQGEAAQMGQVGQYNQQLASQRMGDMMRLIGYAATGGFSGVGGASGASEPWQKKYMGVY